MKLIEDKFANVSIDMSAAPPVWMDIVYKVEEDMKSIIENLNVLQSLQKKNLLPGFDDLSATEESIENVSRSISQKFHSAQDKIKNITQITRLSSDQEQSLAKNVQTSLATKLQDLTSQFRKSQSNYMKKLQARQGSNQQSHQFDEKSNDIVAIDMGFTDAQIQEINQNDQMINQRDLEIAEIARSINDLALMFRDLNMLVIDQGSILDRIDYNVEQVQVYAKDALKQLEKGQEYQKSARKKLIILFLLVLIICSVALLIFKPRITNK
ncbi:t-SNARE [Rozella allomycis CSF55]|uniref:t-SNARE n=1 Tax=Rozella allomycis (strain CSF55) TaxID=988480 RepID=A0A4P9YKV7_ROZAC|nr:t-SNARE [Rozella allomycis CSF55]